MPRYFRVINDETGEEKWCVEGATSTPDKIVLVPVEDEEVLKRLNKPLDTPNEENNG